MHYMQQRKVIQYITPSPPLTPGHMTNNHLPSVVPCKVITKTLVHKQVMTCLAASMRGVQPALFWCSMLDTFFSRRLTTSRWPFQHASVSGILFSLPEGMLTFAPWLSRSWATERWPSLEWYRDHKIITWHGYKTHIVTHFTSFLYISSELLSRMKVQNKVSSTF